MKPGVACLRGVLPRSPAGQVWDVGASLELQIPDIVSFPGDFWVALVLRKDPAQASSDLQCLLGDATHHLCVRGTGVLRLRLGSSDLNLTAAGALPPTGFHLVELWRQGGAIAVAIDGVPATVGTPTAASPLVMAYLFSYFKGQGAFAGDLAMAIFYQRAPSEAERRQLGHLRRRPLRRRPLGRALSSTSLMTVRGPSRYSFGGPASLAQSKLFDEKAPALQRGGQVLKGVDHVEALDGYCPAFPFLFRARGLRRGSGKLLLPALRSSRSSARSFRASAR